MAVSKNILARVVYGDLRVELTAEGASWNPDVADDLIKRVAAMWQNTVTTMQETGAWDALTTVEDEE